MHTTTYTTPPRSPRARRRRGLARACATAAVLLVGGLAGGATVAGAATASPDVVDAARAALPDRDGITHYRVHHSFRAPTTDPIPGLSEVVPDLPAPFDATTEEPVYTSVFERWSAIEPLRDRTAWWYTLPDGSAGTFEESYADSVFRGWASWRNEQPRVVRLSDDEWESYQYERLGRARVWMHNTAATADPIGGIRTMFDNQMLRSTGRTVFEGRSVLRLVGEEPGTPQNQSPGGPIRYEYLVDPRSFAPVRVSGTFTARGPDENGENAERYITTFTFLAFDTLPLNDATRRLLVVGGGH
jgi:hypothetical protein